MDYEKWSEGVMEFSTWILDDNHHFIKAWTNFNFWTFVAEILFVWQVDLVQK